MLDVVGREFSGEFEGGGRFIGRRHTSKAAMALSDGIQSRSWSFLGGDQNWARLFIVV